MAKFSGKQLQILRHELGLTQKELAQKLGVTASTITKYERGERQPEPAVLGRILDVFDVSLDYLFGRSGEKNAEKLLMEQGHQGFMGKEAANDAAHTIGRTPFLSLQETLRYIDISSRSEAINSIYGYYRLIEKATKQGSRGSFHTDIFHTTLELYEEIAQLNGYYFGSNKEDILAWFKELAESRNKVNERLDKLLLLHLKRRDQR